MPRLDPATYWHLRYLQAESEKAMQHAASRELRYRTAMQAAGIPPEIEHRWSDADTSVLPLRAEDETPCAPV